MGLIDEILDKVKGFKADGIAIRSICVQRDGESVEIMFENTPSRNEFEAPQPSYTEEDEERMLDLYHET